MPLGAIRLGYADIRAHARRAITKGPSLIEGDRHAPGPDDGPFRLDARFDAQAARTPGAIALIDAEGSVTYAELAETSAHIAGALRATGVSARAAVGVHVARSCGYVASVLGVLKAGAAVVPLPPDYPAARVREIVAFANLAAVIDDDERPLAAFFHGPIVTLADAAATPAAAASTSASASPDDPAFILRTSGSTGAPKLIVRSHASFRHRLEWTWRTHPYADDDACCQKSPMTTTHAVYELFEPLLRGVAVRILPDAAVRALESFWDALRRHRITRLLIVPSMLQASLDMPGFVAPELRVLVLMGEYVSTPLAARAAAAFPSAAIHSIFGSTEASSALDCDVRAALRTGGELPLGEPLAPDIRAQVLDAALQPAAEGVPGLLYLAGPMLFSGYLNDPALTASVVVERDGERLYCTHDRAVRDRDGALHYLGRIDDVVKVRGFRVDLREVEHALAGCAGVRQCAVIAQDAGGSATLTAYASPEDLDAAAIQHALRATLPDYMVPSRVIALAAMPRTSGGKLDRRHLHELASAAPATMRPPAGTPTQQALAQAWREVLGHADFGRASNFFEVGGSSLKTFAVIARVRAALQLARAQLPDDAIYRHPTFASLAAYLDAAPTHDGAGAIADANPLVTLRQARDAHAAPLFVIASAGGTLGVYAKLMRALQTEREVIGVRDPYLWGMRDATAGFLNWVSLYVRAIRARQSRGPYRLLAYSSAGAFGFEIARALRRAGEAVEWLALIDPVAMDRMSRWRFGYWALAARFMRPELARAALAIGRARALLPHRHAGSSRAPDGDDFRFTPAQFHDFEARARTDRTHVQQLAALMELDTGLPFALTDAELGRVPPTEYLDALLAKVHTLTPEVVPATIATLVVQYALQVRTQHRYRLRWLDAPVVLFEPDGPHCGVLAAQVRPWVRRLAAHRVPMTAPTARVRELARYFPDAMYPHYFCMRDDAFTQTVAQQLGALAGAEGATTVANPAGFHERRAAP